MREHNGVKYLEESDLWKCVHSTAGTDSDGVSVPVCSLSGLMCEEVLRYADETCKFKAAPAEKDTIPWWDEYEEPEFYDR